MRPKAFEPEWMDILGPVYIYIPLALDRWHLQRSIYDLNVRMQICGTLHLRFRIVHFICSFLNT
jgi:hypothetical protein